MLSIIRFVVVLILISSVYFGTYTHLDMYMYLGKYSVVIKLEGYSCDMMIDLTS